MIKFIGYIHLSSICCLSLSQPRGYKLRTRMAFALSNDPQQRKEISEDMKDAYKQAANSARGLPLAFSCQGQNNNNSETTDKRLWTIHCQAVRIHLCGLSIIRNRQMASARIIRQRCDGRRKHFPSPTPSPVRGR